MGGNFEKRRVSACGEWEKQNGQSLNWDRKTANKLWGEMKKQHSAGFDGSGTATAACAGKTATEKFIVILANLISLLDFCWITSRVQVVRTILQRRLSEPKLIRLWERNLFLVNNLYKKRWIPILSLDDQSINQLNNRSIEWLQQSSSHSINQATNQPMKKSINQSITQSIDWWIHTSTEKVEGNDKQSIAKQKCPFSFL